MKKIQRTLIFVLLLCMLFPTVCAFAEGETAAQRGLEKIKTAYNWNCIVLPKEESYLDEWQTRYARKAWYAPNLFVDTMPLLNSGLPYQPFLFEGTEVTVVAEENDMSCILYRGVDYRLYAGWIQSVRLLEDFPGPLYHLGVERDGDFELLHETPHKWSKSYLPQTEQLYTLLDKKVENCVGFTLEYQLIAENTSRKELVMGMRTVWVNDGEDWTPLGCFPYYENGTVRIQIWLPETMDVAAIATVAKCPTPNLFDFRQIGMDFLIEK